MSELKFSCPHCAQHISCDPAWAGHSFQCPSCQKQITAPQPHSELRVTGPTGPPPVVPAPPAHPAATVQPRRPWSSLAIWSLVLCTGLGFGFLGWIAGAICGHKARERIRLNPNLRGWGLATAGLIINYTLLSLLAVGLVLVFTLPPYLKRRHEKQLAQQQQEWAAKEAQRQEQYKRAAAENRIPYREPKLPMPTNAVSGQVNGKEFHYEHAFVQTFSLTLREGQYWKPERQITITTWVKPQDLANKTLQVTPDMRTPRLSIQAEWLDDQKNVQRKNAATGYSLRLKCGPIENSRMAGSIELAMPGVPATAIKGDFVAAVK